jgi:omega-amidase
LKIIYQEIGKLFLMENPNVAICQFKITENKMENIAKARNKIINASNKGATIVILPECFICTYDVNIFKENSEKIYNPNDQSCLAYNMLIETSKLNLDVYIFGGSIIEQDVNGNLYNTCIVTYGGNVIASYRKNHLYTINLTEHSFCEGSVLTPGNESCMVNTRFGRIGLGICYDLRFSDLAKTYMEEGCFMIIYPGSFNRITGPKHWKILQQVRALDNQLYVASCSSACSFGSNYESWGKSYLISPFGEVILETELDKEITIMSEVNVSDIFKVRQRLPILNIAQ